MSRRRTSTDDPNQLLINWSARVRPTPAAAPASPVLVLPWDFAHTFPQPLDEAIDAGVIDASDTTATGLRSLHEEYGRQAIETLRERDRLADARRRGVDPRTGRQSRTPAARDRLAKALVDGPERQDHAFDVLILTYRDAFGDAAADAFAKALRARHAGVEVVDLPNGVGARHGPNTAVCAETNASAKNVKRASIRTKSGSARPRRMSTVLPVPKPLCSAVAAGHFGHEAGVPVHPGPQEVRAITEQHAERMIAILEERGAKAEEVQRNYAAALAKYAESFGGSAAERLDAHVRHEVAKNAAPTRSR